MYYNNLYYDLIIKIFKIKIILKMKMNMFYRNLRRNFSSSANPYHHDFNPGHLSENQGLVAFDFVRVVFYSVFLANISLNSLSFLLFRRKKFLNNPDYIIVDEKTFLNSASETK